MDKVYQVVLSLEDSARLIHLGVFTDEGAAMDCMQSTTYEGEPYSTQIWEHEALSGYWGGAIDLNENLANALFK